MQWTTNITGHAHINKIKVPAHTGNNHNYYNQIAQHLNRLNKCFRFDLAIYIEEWHQMGPAADEESSEDEEDHKPDAEKLVSKYSTPTHLIVNYFAILFMLLNGSNPTAPKPLLQLTLQEAALKYKLPDLVPAICNFIAQWNCNLAPDNIKLQIWHSVCVQQTSYHKKDLEPLQTLCAISPSASNLYGEYNSVIISNQSESNWPKHGLVGHTIIQLCVIFQPLHCNFFAAYIQHFNVGSMSMVTQMPFLK
ncbi:hypothetical protein JVU11DRAFT_8409 [Chiua virens]|nr:hypothetical protein JVU11DRAFT_8409 [Chiua virens]